MPTLTDQATVVQFAQGLLNPLGGPEQAVTVCSKNWGLPLIQKELEM